MTENHGLLYPLALFKQRYTRGTSWTQIVLNFGIITANAKLFEDFFPASVQSAGKDSAGRPGIPEPGVKTHVLYTTARNRSLKKF